MVHDIWVRLLTSKTKKVIKTSTNGHFAMNDDDGMTACVLSRRVS